MLIIDIYREERNKETETRRSFDYQRTTCLARRRHRLRIEGVIRWEPLLLMQLLPVSRILTDGDCRSRWWHEVHCLLGLKGFIFQTELYYWRANRVMYSSFLPVFDLAAVANNSAVATAHSARPGSRRAAVADTWNAEAWNGCLRYHADRKCSFPRNIQITRPYPKQHYD